MSAKPAVVLLSGGLDSATTLAVARRDGFAPHALSFRYGQRHALEQISRRIQTSRARLDNPNRPIGVFMLVGPSGTGKTETALTLAEALLGTGVVGAGNASSPDREGFEPQVSNVARIYVIRGDFAAPGIFKLDASSADAMLLASNFPLRPRDVVFVATYDVSRWSRVMSQIVPTINSLWQVYDVVQRTNP